MLPKAKYDYNTDQISEYDPRQQAVPAAMCLVYARACPGLVLCYGRPNLVPRGRDPFGQLTGQSKGTPGDEVADGHV